MVGFARMNGRTVGIVGNQPTEAAGQNNWRCLLVNICILVTHIMIKVIDVSIIQAFFYLLLSKYKWTFFSININGPSISFP